MEPVTHLLTGACLARSGLNRRTAYATATLAIAAEFPDIDTLWSLRGPVSGFQHHRGMTHTFIGIPFEAAFLVALVYGFHHGKRRSSKQIHSEAAVLPRWGWLYLFTCLALLSHLFLDFTNNYGIRPFFPFSAKWFAGSFVFIFDPLLFFLLLAGLLLPFLFQLVSREIGAARTAYTGAGWARAALLAAAAFWAVRAYEHSRAMDVAAEQTLRAPARVDPEVLSPDPSAPVSSPVRPLLLPHKILASPDPLSPFRWYTVIDFGPAYQIGQVDSRSGNYGFRQTLAKPEENSLIQRAEHTQLGRVYLDWSSVPWITVATKQAGTPAQQGTVVLFQDWRFLVGGPLLERGTTAPLTGKVLFDPQGRVMAQGMGAHWEHGLPVQ